MMKRFYSNNNKKLLEAIHELNKPKIELKKFTDADVVMEYVLDKIQRNEFHVKIGLQQESCPSLVCRLCNDDRFLVGQREYYTALKCMNCNYEIGIHEG